MRGSRAATAQPASEQRVPGFEEGREPKGQGRKSAPLVQLHPIMARPLAQIAISETELAPFVTGNTQAGKAHALLEQQKGVWELLRNGYDTLRTVQTKVFDFDGFQVKVQFNPGRLISTVAKVDATSIKERKCFLCTRSEEHTSELQ